MASDPVHLDDVEAKVETDLALLCEIDGEEKWVPKKAIHDDSEVYSMKNSTGTLVVERWWAEKEGLV
jgi:hypothetical protein